MHGQVIRGLILNPRCTCIRRGFYLWRPGKMHDPKTEDQAVQDPLDSCDCESVGVYHSHEVTEPQNGSQRLPRWLQRSLVRDQSGELKTRDGYDA